jgi:hypothetical protein
MLAVRHCRHCWGPCSGECLIPGRPDLCIHKPSPRLAFRQRMLLLLDRSFWHRVFWGVR